jgi:hypothetical protein
MNKKSISFLIIGVLLIVTFLPLASASNEINDDSQNDIMFGLASIIEAELDDEDTVEPIRPNVESRVVDLSIRYKVTRGVGFFSNFIYELCKGRKVEIKFEIINIPNWCAATLNSDTLITSISDEWQELSISLMITVSEDAPAHMMSTVRIRASLDDIEGPFGLLTWINGFDDQYAIAFEPAYLGLIQTVYPLEDQIVIRPYNETKIPINITNLGNGRTKIVAEVINCSKSWDVAIEDPIILDVEETKKIYLTVKADHKFKEESIKLKFTPKFAPDLSEIGESQYATLLFINDGSYKEEEPVFKLDTLTIALIIGIILLLIGILIVIKKRRQN